jgi:hypothetical protein
MTVADRVAVVIWRSFWSFCSNASARYNRWCRRLSATNVCCSLTNKTLWHAWSSDCLSRIDKRSTSHRESCDNEESSQIQFSECKFESLKSFWSFSTDHAAWVVFCRSNRSVQRSNETQRTHTWFICLVSDHRENDSFSFFFDCEIKQCQDWAERDQLTRRVKHVFKISAC